MAPSRGIYLISHAFRQCSRFSGPLAYGRKRFSTFTEKLTNPKNRVQSYLSTSDDPCLNLSIEDYILRKSPPESYILFLYTNRPCVVIGRNQNPWTEVNLSILNVADLKQSAQLKETEPPAIGNVELVRRRSGGGTVFHDEGNLNWSITCPRTDFTRDKHAEMVVRALRKLGVNRARVNERHDIVLDQGNKELPVDPEDTHRTTYTLEDGASPRPLKVSGSAYKLTRGRALHHATTLLASPNLHIIPQYLRSPAKPFIEAKGVESVSSPVGNIGLDDAIFRKEVQKQFGAMYAKVGEAVVDFVGDEYLNIPEIKKGYDELKTKEWILSQTPQFTLNAEGPSGEEICVTVHHGVIKSFHFQGAGLSNDIIEAVSSALLEQQMHEISDWRSLLGQHVETQDASASAIIDCLERFLPLPKLTKD
ncbi:hypothetical protein BU24DRAFT_421085 [Aaosphaeria arxii CBS 175.79]|uniref:Putative lipoate-protein ligase A n=1 Tax=Aaosphaeria arxii CBS 175.79 TaxID=1450172 RepID=A0A6A5XYN1_9PLEO|nr:uncharacterized protein BU24DRAFT_421085 [Aaosphaeria arxii CBS 175.79]KAF2018069.1 hypothetical protein BU24DRAFT_421085 [Aaosphaeria arxii CBS 175.79]